MKTSVILNSPDRELFGVKIRQDTKTGFLSLSDLQEAYAHGRVKKGWLERRIDNVLQSEQNKERIYYILESQGVTTTGFTGFMELSNSQGFTKTLKQLNVYKTQGARQNKTTWCDPYIWVLVAMEMNPMLYSKVVVWLTDNLIINRIEAGNFYKELSKSVSKFHNVDYVRLAKALNHIVFGRHENGIRNTGTVSQLKEMEQLESKMAFAIDMGYITSFDNLIGELTKIWKQKYHTKQIAQ